MLIHRVGRVLLTKGIRGIRPRLAVRCSLAAKVIYAYWSGIPDLYRRSQRLAETEDVQGWHAFNARETRAYRKLPISAIIRMRNVAPTLHLSVESIIASVSEVWLVDNGSDDASLEVARALQERYPDQVRLSQYAHQLGSYGPTYLDQVEIDETRSVAAFYNFSFRLGTAKYLLKWDADMIALATHGRGLICLSLTPQRIEDLGLLIASQTAEIHGLAVLERLWPEDGRLLRTYRAGKAHLDAYLEDYAALVLALGLTALVFARFWFPWKGMFVFSPGRAFAVFSANEGLARFAFSHVFLAVNAAATLSIAFLFSCFNMKPAAATILALSYLFVNMVMEHIPFFDSYENWFITHHFGSWIQVFQSPIPWAQIVQSQIILVAMSTTAFVIGSLAFQVRDFKA